MEILASPWMLSCSLGCSCLASLALSFLVVCDVWVKGSRVSPSCRLVSCAKIKYTLGHILLVFILNSFFFNQHSRIFSGVWKETFAGVNTFREVCNLQKKKFKISITPYTGYWKFYTWALFSLSYVHSRLTLTPREMRAHGKSVESHTRTVSSRVTLAWESCRTHSVRVYSRHKIRYHISWKKAVMFHSIHRASKGQIRYLWMLFATENERQIQ